MAFGQPRMRGTTGEGTKWQGLCRIGVATAVDRWFCGAVVLVTDRNVGPP